MKEIKRFVRYIRKTAKNKLFVMTMLVVGALSAILSGDGTFLMFVLMFSVPMFISKEDWFYKPED